MKKQSCIPSSTAAAILAGGLIFSGPASAALVFTEDFDGATNQFGMSTYAYSMNYTQPNGLTPGGGVNYAHGGNGVAGSVSTNTFGPLSASLLVDGLSTVLIDAGLGTYSFYAQFSTYLAQNDFAEISVTFKDGASADLGAPVVLGGAAFVSALGADGGGLRAWGDQTFAGTIPVGARSVSISMAQTKSAPGTVIDGYVDNIVLNAQAVPEPGTAALLLLGAAGFLRRRRS